MKTELGPFTISLTDQTSSPRNIEANTSASLLYDVMSSVIELTDLQHLKGNPKVFIPVLISNAVFKSCK